MIAYLDDEPLTAQPAGSALTADVPFGTTRVQVEWAVDFDADGGLAFINDRTVRYVSSDEDSITLLAPATTAWSVDDDIMVLALNARGEVEHDYHVNVRFDLDDSETVSVEVSSDQVKWVSEADAGLAVEVEAVRGGYRLVGFEGRTGQLNGDAVWNPHLARQANAATIPSGSSTWTPVTSWTDLEVDGITLDGGDHIIDTAGYYAIRVQLAYASNAVGHRRVRVLLNGDTAFPVAYFALAADDAGATYVLAVTEVRLDEEDVITVEANQSSGAGLALYTGPGRSTFGIYRISV